MLGLEKSLDNVYRVFTSGYKSYRVFILNLAYYLTSFFRLFSDGSQFDPTDNRWLFSDGSQFDPTDNRWYFSDGSQFDPTDNLWLFPRPDRR